MICMRVERAINLEGRVDRMFEVLKAERNAASVAGDVDKFRDLSEMMGHLMNGVNGLSTDPLDWHFAVLTAAVLRGKNAQMLMQEVLEAMQEKFPDSDGPRTMLTHMQFNEAIDEVRARRPELSAVLDHIASMAFHASDDGQLFDVERRAEGIGEHDLARVFRSERDSRSAGREHRTAGPE